MDRITGKTSLTQEELVDKVKGIIFGKPEDVLRDSS